MGNDDCSTTQVNHFTKQITMNKLFLCFFSPTLFFASLFGGNLFSQSSSVPAYDTSYIDKAPSKYSVRVYTASKENHLYFFNQKWSNRITFHPQTNFVAGLGFSYKTIAVDLGLTVYKKSILSDQTTKGFNFIGSLYTNRNLVDVTFQTNKGFTESASISGVTENINRNDVKVFNFGVNYNYIFNFRRYSFNAAAIGTQIQKKSAGSLMAGAFFTYINVSADSSIIPGEFLSLFNPADLYYKQAFYSAGLTAGYAYTLVLPYRFFITASLTPGITFSLGKAKDDSLNLFKNLPVIAPKFVTRDAIGYGGRKFYATASYSLDISATALGKKNFLVYTPEKFKVVVGYRIR